MTSAEERPLTRTEAQVRLVLEQLPDVVAWPDNWSETELDYLCRNHVVLVRDSDLSRVEAALPGEPDSHENNVNGVTRYRYTDGRHPE